MWTQWNDKEVKKYFKNGFDGIDWDLEGNDDVNSPFNEFSVETLDAMGVFSQLMKKAGFVVSMAPAETYFSPYLNGAFSRSLRFKDPLWEAKVTGLNFPYHGANCYAYVYTKYGTVPGVGDTFDFVTVQLYEGYSHTLYRLLYDNIPPAQVIQDAIASLQTPWWVNFSSDSTVNFRSQMVNIKPEKLVIGLGNGWADNIKFLFVDTKDVGIAYDKSRGSVRGFAYWNIAEEGRVNEGKQIWFARGLNKFLHIRNAPQQEGETEEI